MLELVMEDLKNTVIQNKGERMSTYECSKCGMSVNATCGKCNEPLVNDMLKLDDNSEVQISKCPNDHGKIKSPLCCGQDMSCKI
jgi:hypothetical protein